MVFISYASQFLVFVVIYKGSGPGDHQASTWGKASFLKLYFLPGETEGSDLLPQPTDYQQKYILDEYDQ